jgi:hypothetical protein
MEACSNRHTENKRLESLSLNPLDRGSNILDELEKSINTSPNAWN